MSKHARRRRYRARRRLDRDFMRLVDALGGTLGRIGGVRIDYRARRIDFGMPPLHRTEAGAALFGSDGLRFGFL